MTELLAISSLNPSWGTHVLRRSSANGKGKYSKAWRRRNVFMLLESDMPVAPLTFNGAQVSVAFSGDLLEKSRKALTEPAAYVAMLYEQYGDDFAESLRGSFAIILYDHVKHTLKAWTDHFGVQPLFYTESRECVAVATSLKSLLRSLHASPQIDPAAIHEYLQYTCIPTPKTIYEGVSKLAPGHRLTLNARSAGVTTRSLTGRLSVQSYWDMSYLESTGKESEAAWAARLSAAARSAVSQNLTGPKHSEAGCFLSGGTDSSSISGLVGQLTGEPPNTFSIGFDDRRYNEIHYARIAAKHFNANHHEYFVTPGDILSLLPKAAGVYDEPFGNSSIIPTYFCARLAAQHGITHLLAGDGGDELFGGNSRYVDDRVFQKYSLIPAWIRRCVIEPAASVISNHLSWTLFRRAASYVRRANLKTPDRYFSYTLLSSVSPADLFTGDFLRSIDGHDALDSARIHFHAADTHSELNRWLYLDLKITITDNDLRKVTAMSRLAGVTPRYPFLDPSLAEFTGTMPAYLKVRGTQLRYLFKKAMRDVLPMEIIRKKKHGFGLPFSIWVGENKPLRDFTFDVLGTAQCRQRGYFRRDILDWLWSRYETVHRQYYGDVLWVFLMLELWHIGQTAAKKTQSAEVAPPLPLMPVMPLPN
jgi:asparagine synthase (glutamine-hydrolysing)